MKKNQHQEKKEYHYRLVRIPDSLGTSLERAHKKYYPNMFKSVSDFSEFILREWIANMLDKDPSLAEDLDFTDFY